MTVSLSGSEIARQVTECLPEAVIEAGAGTVNLPDTVGYAIPSEDIDGI